MDARSTVREYYDALRTGDPLAPYFAKEHDDDDAFVKFGISERLVGSEQIKTGLRTQTETTAEWKVNSHALRVCERGTHAWFSDTVSMEWTSTESGERHEFNRVSIRHRDEFGGVNVALIEGMLQNLRVVSTPLSTVDYDRYKTKTSTSGRRGN